MLHFLLLISYAYYLKLIKWFLNAKQTKEYLILIALISLCILVNLSFLYKQRYLPVYIFLLQKHTNSNVLQDTHETAWNDFEKMSNRN